MKILILLAKEALPEESKLFANAQKDNTYLLGSDGFFNGWPCYMDIARFVLLHIRRGDMFLVMPMLLEHHYSLVLLQSTYKGFELLCVLSFCSFFLRRPG